MATKENSFEAFALEKVCMCMSMNDQLLHERALAETVDDIYITLLGHCGIRN